MPNTNAEWTVSKHSEPLVRRGEDEDGPYEYLDHTQLVWSVLAVHMRGKEYANYDRLKDEAAADALVQDLLVPGVDPAEHPAMTHIRTQYGSDDWGIEDEIGLMDDEEHHARGF